MNIILTNFASTFDNIGAYATIGAPFGVVSGLVVNDDGELSFVDKSLRGAVGGVLGGTLGGAISSEQVFGPMIGGTLGGIIANKIAKRKSLKDALRNAYYDLQEKTRDDDNPYGFSDDGSSGGNNYTSKTPMQEMKAQERKTELTRDVNDLESERRDISDQIKEIDGKMSEDSREIDDASIQARQRIDQGKNPVIQQNERGKAAASYDRNSEERQRLIEERNKIQDQIHNKRDQISNLGPKTESKRVMDQYKKDFKQMKRGLLGARGYQSISSMV